MEDTDAILVGSGIMSSTLAVLLHRLDPNLHLQVYEAAPVLSPESSHGWHNAGTGHAGLCELSYTPSRGFNGEVLVDKALEIFAQFERSKQFWAHAVATQILNPIGKFLRPVPHVSFVHGDEQVDFLRSRHRGLQGHPLFSKMEFTCDKAVIARWAPLLMEGRDPRQSVAATRMTTGTDVDFGSLSRQFLQWLADQRNCAVATNHKVKDLVRDGGRWVVTTVNVVTGETRRLRSRFVFIGAGGSSLLLLQKAGIPEAKGFGGFPIGGQWLVCDKLDIVSRHAVKVYGQALGAAPTMAVPHLDARVLDQQRSLLFGPYATWTTKFLQVHGNHGDLVRSLRADNVGSMAKAGIDNLQLVRYLIQQSTQSMTERMRALREYYPAARREDWRIVQGGIRVQIVKKTAGQAGIVHFGTEIVRTADRSMAALLGASPGASVAVDIMLNVARECFPDVFASPAARTRLEEMIPTWDRDLTSVLAASHYCQAAMPSVEARLGIHDSASRDPAHSFLPN